MPKCENTQCGREDVSPEEMHEEASTGRLFCDDCIVDKQVVSTPAQEAGGAAIDYAISYSKKSGLRAGVVLGGASLTLEVSQEELSRTLGLK